MKTPNDVMRILVICTEINMPPDVQRQAMEDAILCIAELVDKLREWQAVASSPNAVKETRWDNEELMRHTKHLARINEAQAEKIRDAYKRIHELEHRNEVLLSALRGCTVEEDNHATD